MLWIKFLPSSPLACANQIHYSQDSPSSPRPGEFVKISTAKVTFFLLSHEMGTRSSAVLFASPLISPGIFPELENNHMEIPFTSGVLERSLYGYCRIQELCFHCLSLD